MHLFISESETTSIVGENEVEMENRPLKCGVPGCPQKERVWATEERLAVHR